MKQKQNLSTADMSYIAMMTVVIAVCSWIYVPSAVPFTMQTFGVFCALGLLGGRRGFLAVLLYVLMGAAGLPVFSGFTGGLGQLLGPTGGYILGFLLMALAYRLTDRRPERSLKSMGRRHASGPCPVLCLRDGLVHLCVFPRLRPHRPSDRPGLVRFSLSPARRDKALPGPAAHQNAGQIYKVRPCDKFRAPEPAVLLSPLPKGEGLFYRLFTGAGYNIFHCAAKVEA